MNKKAGSNATIAKSRQRFLSLNQIAFILICAVTCECAIGSSGRWLEFGFFSIRIILFILALLITLPLVIQNIRWLAHNAITIILLAFAGCLCFSTIYGILHGNSFVNIAEDIKPFLFLILVLGYMVVIQNEQRLMTLVKAISFASLILAFITVLIHFTLLFLSERDILLLNHEINALALGGLFDFGDGINRIYFRSSIFFIIPFLYNLSIVLRNGKPKRKYNILPYIFMSVCADAILITYTRSIWLGVLGAFICFLIIKRKQIMKIVKAVGITAIGVTIFILLSWVSYGFEGVIYNAVSRLTPDYEERALEWSESEYELAQRKIIIQSDSTRTERLEALTEDIEENWLFGCGLGSMVTIQGIEIKTEYTYLEILRKMGVFGSAAFLTLLLSPFFIAWQQRRNKICQDGIAIVASAMLCMLISSIFNPYLTSPLGFSVYGMLAGTVFMNRHKFEPAQTQQNTLESETTVTM